MSRRLSQPGRKSESKLEMVLETIGDKRLSILLTWVSSYSHEEKDVQFVSGVFPTLLANEGEGGA